MLTLEFVKLIGEIFSFPVQPICSTNKHSNNMYEKLHFEKNNFHTLSVLTQFSTCIRYQQCINFCTKGTTLPLHIVMKISEVGSRVSSNQISFIMLLLLFASCKEKKLCIQLEGMEKGFPTAFNYTESIIEKQLSAKT